MFEIVFLLFPQIFTRYKAGDVMLQCGWFTITYFPTMAWYRADTLPTNHLAFLYVLCRDSLAVTVAVNHAVVITPDEAQLLFHSKYAGDVPEMLEKVE